MMSWKSEPCHLVHGALECLIDVALKVGSYAAPENRITVFLDIHIFLYALDLFGYVYYVLALRGIDRRLSKHG